MFCYLVIAVIAGFAGYSYLFRPLIDDALQSGSNNVFTNDRRLTLTVFSILAGILGPVTLVLVLVPSYRQRVYDTLSDLFNE